MSNWCRKSFDCISAVRLWRRVSLGLQRSWYAQRLWERNNCFVQQLQFDIRAVVVVILAFFVLNSIAVAFSFLPHPCNYYFLCRVHDSDIPLVSSERLTPFNRLLNSYRFACRFWCNANESNDKWENNGSMPQKSWQIDNEQNFVGVCVCVCVCIDIKMFL